MEITSRILMVFILLIGFCTPTTNVYAQTEKPNILFILADDSGWTSLNSYGADKSLVRTPHINDPGEKNNLYNEDSDKVKQLHTELDRIRKATSTR